jgi:hypothetical protein
MRPPKQGLFVYAHHIFVRNGLLLKQAGIQEVVIFEIMGHANDSMTMSRYGNRYQPKVLLESMMKLDYGIDVMLLKH